MMSIEYTRKIVKKISIGLFLIPSLTYGYQFPKSNNGIISSPQLELLDKMSKGVSDLAEKAGKAVVFVSVSKTIRGYGYGDATPYDFFFGPRGKGQYRSPEKKQAGLGSGFLVDLDRGYIITNNHVIEGADEISLQLANGEKYDGKVLGRDKNTDVAIVQIKNKKYNRKGLLALTLGNSDEARAGQLVVALGAPFGLKSSLSFGVLSATKRGALGITDLGNFLQTDAAINPGNSGGPLLDMSGQVIGMNTAIYSRSGGSAGIGFAVPANIVRKVAGQLVNKGAVSRGYLGVSLAQELDEDIALGLGVPENVEGALISQVQPGAPAAKAGLESGDIIIEVAGKKVKSNNELKNTVGLLQPNQKVKIVFYRNGKLKNITVALASYKSPDNPIVNTKKLSSGLSLSKIRPGSPEYKSQKSTYGFKSKKGLLVTQVERNSKAWGAGIREGDVLLKVNRRNLDSVANFNKLYNKSKRLLVQLDRQGNFLFASIRK